MNGHKNRTLCLSLHLASISWHTQGCATYLGSRVQRIWLFFRKWRIQTLWWVHNWNLRHIYWIHFLIFWAVSCAFGFKVWKSTNMTLKNFFWEKIEKGVKKRRNLRWFRIRWKSCEKMRQKVWRTWVKVKKVHFSVTFLLITFFL
jgi:hypothetical protein